MVNGLHVYIALLPKALYNLMQADSSRHPPQRINLQTFQGHLSSLQGSECWTLKIKIFCVLLKTAGAEKIENGKLKRREVSEREKIYLCVPENRLECHQASYMKTCLSFVPIMLTVQRPCYQ